MDRENCLYSGSWDELEYCSSDLAQCQTGGGLNSNESNATTSSINASFLLPSLGDPDQAPPPPPLAPPGTTDHHHHHQSSSSSFQLAAGYAYGIPVPTTDDLWSSFNEDQDKSASASKNHSQAEKRRRDRINAHLSTLRKLIPMSDKMDKATLLGSAVEQVKDLKRKALEVGRVFRLPSEIDEVIINDHSSFGFDSSDSNHEHKEDRKLQFIKASICCEDRPELFSELKHAINGLKLTTVQAQVTSLGGRIQGIFILCTEDQEEEEDDSKKLDGIGMNKLKQSLRAVLSRIASSSAATNYRIKSKRRRFFFPSDHHQNQSF